MSRIVEKIRKLLNLASNDAAAPNESDVARQLAEKLMAASGLTEDEVRGATDVDPSASVRAEPSPEGDAHGNLVAGAIARIVGCYVYSKKLGPHKQRCRGCDAVQGQHDHFVEGGRVLMWVGTDDQRDTAVELHAWVCRQIDRLAEGARRTAKNQAHPRRWLNSYRMGVASAISEQSKAMVEYRKRNQSMSAEGLVVRDNVERAIAKYKAGLNLHRGRVKRAGEGYDIGKQDGSSIELRRSMGSQKRLGSGE